MAEKWRVPLQHCPHCGATLSGAGADPRETSPRPPQPGDITLCLVCTAPLVYGDGLMVRLLTPAEFQGMTDAERKHLLGLRDLVDGFQRAQGALLN